jgi:hypothetical protein
MYLPFGVKPIIKEWSNFTEYNIDCSLNQSSSETSIVFRDSIEKVDKIIQKLVKNNIEMFNNKNETANENFTYQNILKENGNYPKLMKLQLTRDKNGNFESFIFNEKKEKVQIDEKNISDILPKGKTFKSIIECVKIWYFNGKVGSIWRVVQLKFSERESISSHDFNNDTVNVYNQLMIED